jgi:type II secretory pathway component PulJ
MRAKGESGFSTLEVIAAVAIIAIALVPIATLQIQLTRAQARLAEAHTESTDVHNAMALLRDINPMTAPSGARRLDDQSTLTWTSAAVSPLRQSVTPPGFEVQLYRVNGVIQRTNAPTTTIQLDLVGWRSGNASARE